MKYLISLQIILIFSISCISTRQMAEYDHETHSEFIVLSTNYSNMSEIEYKTIKKYCKLRDLDILFVCALIQEESRFNQSARGRAGERGMMQIMEYHYPQDPRKLTTDIDLHVRVGTSYLKRCVDKAKRLYPYNYQAHAIRMYNAGLNSKIRRYRNWRYLFRILNNYTKTIQELNYSS